ncbi:MAG: CehA/McbA family metallohydrolase [Alphaproteobacteria bacterium]|nr:CehA/McbA family metallohydrolase [Alphaproteobacteria bacterium]MBU1515089.1 CehA/McbA family metallohydrolase [Alphaproteobacteria bacterium]MBU2093447.1 CehA/McbA family metallohydrolase [Alphaproteobacteria bacterium]MBU2152295.1 CehA/McbA family metallohydrolase [Alphaproteobacteria bacterium]MBU2308109.1 CehA/McbA family metallohydrolase [Alphaproteobacteria bacterium]
MRPLIRLASRATFSRKRRRIALALLLGLLFGAPAAAETLTLTGVMTGADHQTYREVPFKVPAGTTSVSVDFAYTGKDQKSVIDLGIRDPQRFRGWSGGNKATFTLTETWATPSYLPGPLPAGDWKLILGVPNLRKDGRAEYTAKITLDRSPVFHGFAAAPLKAGPGWYRGDLHMHTQHSDGSCASRTGKRVPCPLFKTLEAASARGLDFVAVTDHNTPAHFQDLAELQPYYDDLLLIPGREITTFHGHANVFGVTAPLDFQLGGPRAPDLNRIIDQVEAAKGLISLNHPGQPSGEVCMGCGWTAKTDFARIPAIEAINGVNADGPLSGVPFWEARLNAGFPITAIGGSDNHDAGLTGARGVGTPTTVVYAENLSQDAILDGVRKGRVFIDVQGTRDRLLDARLEAGKLVVHVAKAAGGRLVFSGPGAAGLADAAPLGDDDTRTFAAPAIKGWLRVDVRGPDGKLWLLGNPVRQREQAEPLNH